MSIFGLTFDHDLRKSFLQHLSLSSLTVYERLFDIEHWHQKLSAVTYKTVVIEEKSQIADAIRMLGGRVFVKARRSDKDVPGGLSAKRTENEVIEVIEKSSRIQEDLKCGAKIVLREYVEQEGIEFRGFICQSRLTCVSLQPN